MATTPLCISFTFAIHWGVFTVKKISQNYIKQNNSWNCALVLMEPKMGKGIFLPSLSPRNSSTN